MLRRLLAKVVLVSLPQLRESQVEVHLRLRGLLPILPQLLGDRCPCLLGFLEPLLPLLVGLRLLLLQLLALAGKPVNLLVAFRQDLRVLCSLALELVGVGVPEFLHGRLIGGCGPLFHVFLLVDLLFGGLDGLLRLGQLPLQDALGLDLLALDLLALALRLAQLCRAGLHGLGLLLPHARLLRGLLPQLVGAMLRLGLSL
mmetsp:Transcript_2844/g.8461  ORF Transcript_2844/g.8461 Transcript_2844/m.8461 type:complete len:200 (-) Transcript_2844:1291-1890(-)